MSEIIRISLIDLIQIISDKKEEHHTQAEWQTVGRTFANFFSSLHQMFLTEVCYDYSNDHFKLWDFKCVFNLIYARTIYITKDEPVRQINLNRFLCSIC